MSRGSIKGFEKERLSQILAVRGLSQGQLASLVGVSPTTISKWRAGNQTPEREALERLALRVNVSPDWFIRAPTKKLSPPLFRSNASAHVAARKMLEARLEWAQDVACAFAEFVDFPTLNLPAAKFEDLEQITTQDIESAASECRDLWKLNRSPVQDLALAIEGAGVILVREETGIAQIEGLSAWSEELSRPLVLLSADKQNCYRGRFDLAHELGHLVLHRHIHRVSDPGRHKQLEKQAHAFAGAFLLPAESFASEVRTPVTLDDLLLLKKRWGASVAAILMRLKALRILDEDAAQLMFKRRSARWGAKSEPGDNDRPPERPRLLRRTVDLIVEANILPLESIPRHLGLAAYDIEKLADLKEGYFEVGNSNVVRLAQIRQTTSRNSENSPTSSGNRVVPFRPITK